MVLVECESELGLVFLSGCVGCGVFFVGWLCRVWVMVWGVCLDFVVVWDVVFIFD